VETEVFDVFRLWKLSVVDGDLGASVPAVSKGDVC
jgi:hypothetical protein